MADEEADVWYPTVDDILLIHEDIIEEDPDATPGIRDETRIQFAIDYVEEGYFEEKPSTIHEKAFHLMRLIASNHWFADGNKRTALNATELFYLVNGYELDYGDDVRSMLKLFSVREDLIDADAGSRYLRDRTTAFPDEAEDADPRAALGVLIVGLVAAYSDGDTEELVSDSEVDVESVREEFGLTTEYGTTVNIGDDEPEDDDGG